MNKALTAIAIGFVAAAATATAFAFGVDQNSEKISADLTLLQKGELVSVHFSPTFEEDLSDKERIVYNAVSEGIVFLDTRINIADAGYTDGDQLTSFLSKVFNLHPEWNGIDDKITYVVTDGVITEIIPRYNVEEIMLSALAPFADEYVPTQDRIDHALADIKDEMTDVEKALILHDYLVREVDYNLAVQNGGAYSDDVFTMKGVFVDRDAVCQGYSLAYSFLLDKVGVESMIVASESMNHAWNMINIDGSWYHVDVTWDDPSNGVEVDFCRGGFVRHLYFLRSDEEFQNEFEHFGWEDMYQTNTVPEAKNSNAFDGWSFRPMNADGTEGEIGMISYVDGKFCYLSDLWGSNILVKSKINGNDRTEISLADTYKYLFHLSGKLYASNSSRIYELETDGSVVRTVAAASGQIRNFWLKEDTLAYYDVKSDGTATRKIVDLERGAENVISENGFTFAIGDDGNATLVEYKGTGGLVLNIPSSVKGYPVTEIGAEVFKSNKNICKVVIPEGVTTIGDQAFMQSEVTEIVLPKSLVTIGDYAVFNCNNIKNIQIPLNVESIGNKAFYACFRMETVYFHDDVPTEWGAEVFGKIEEQIEIKHHTIRWGWNECNGAWTDPTGVTYKASVFGTHVYDINHDGIANGIDVAYIIDVISHPGDHTECTHLQECNCNDDDVADENDAVYMLWELIHGFDD